MGQLLSHPLTEKTIEYNDYRDPATGTYNSRSIPRFFNCVGSMQGYRLTQEDAHMVINEHDALRVRFYNPFSDKVEDYSVSMFAVFDGHGGDDCSTFLSGGKERRGQSYSRGYNPKVGLAKWVAFALENHHYGAVGRHKVGEENLIIRDKVASSGHGDGRIRRVFHTLEGLISQVLKDSFFLQDDALYKYFSNTQCGSTAVVAVIVNGEMLFVANAGDSRCILSSMDHSVKTMSFDHKPQHIGELIRINDNGGIVSLGRVGGVLALSRAFSDFQFKRSVLHNYIGINTAEISTSDPTTPTGSPPATPTEPRRHSFADARSPRKHYRTHFTTLIAPQESQVTCEPDVLVHKIDYKRDEFLVLACDGIWDVYSNKELVQFIKDQLVLGVPLDVIIAKILDHGIARADSSTGVGFDNMTLIILVLNKRGETLADWYTKMRIRLEKERVQE